jgi:hypothetical protein
MLEGRSGASRDKAVVYYESIKRELKIRPILECQCDERIKAKKKDEAFQSWLPGAKSYRRVVRNVVFATHAILGGKSAEEGPCGEEGEK